MRRTVSLFACLAAVSLPTVAHAQGCPPGSWFCADVTVPGPAKPEAKPDAKPEAKPDAVVDDRPGAAARDEKKAADATTIQVPPSNGNTTIIVNTTPPKDEAKPPPPRVVPPPPPPPRYEPLPPPPPSPRHRSEWGFNMRLEGIGMGDKHRAGRASDAGMGGVGFSLRARPVPHLAVDFGLDFVGGKDFQGYRRSEVPFSVNALIYVNPRNKLQFYFLGGVGWSTASVEIDQTHTDHYSYFGAQGGIGLEYRISRSVALNVDMLGFIRGRTDEQARVQPEFVDPSTGRTTNTSGGGLFRGGVTIYW